MSKRVLIDLTGDDHDQRPTKRARTVATILSLDRKSEALVL
jgi:hypothetical protein